MKQAQGRLSLPSVALSPPVPRDPMEPLLQAEVQAALYDLLARLPRRLQRVIVAYYDFGNLPPYSSDAVCLL